jgi:predicted ATPase/DNA-binding SARP family transcriptional activator
VLGPLRVTGEGEVALPRSSHRRLLSILTLHAGRRIGTDALIDRNWRDAAPATAKAVLQTHVSALRKLLPAGVIATEGYGYRLDLDGHELDAETFGRLAADAREAAASRDWESALAAVREAVDLWRGPPYDELADDDFARPEITRLEELRLELLELETGALLALGREQEALPELERLVVEHPLRERLWEQLMTARYRTGRHAEALEAYRQAWAALDEIGLEPSAELRRLEQRILLHDEALASPTRHNLPVELTGFVGREQELAEVSALLDGHRLVTLTGVGGSGKTRLALRVAADGLGAFPDGCWLVELASLRDAELVPLEVASALGLRSDADDSLRTVTAALARDTTLLVIDNCEHLLDAAGTLVRAALDAGPDVRVVATSREPLRVPGEVVFEVPPLSFPDDPAEQSGIATFDAVRLFLDRAALAGPTFEPGDADLSAVARVCRRLDGMPLAIELAAGRIGSLSAEAIADNLDNRFGILTGGAPTGPKRHRTLEAALHWSYDLLTEEERLLFARLSVFLGGFTLEAAEGVCAGDGIEAADVVPLVSSLVDKSLVSRHAVAGDRYRLLETVRDYAVTRLAEIGDPQTTRQRHLDWYAAVASSALRHIHAPGRWELLGRIAIEADNLDAAAALASELGDDTGVASISRILAWREYDQGLHDRAAAHLRLALEHTTEPEDVAACTSLLGTALFLRGDPDAAFEASRRAVALAAELPPSAGTVWVLTALARLHLLHIDRDPGAAIPLCRDAVAIAETSDDPFALIYAHRGLARGLSWNGEADEGLEHMETALALARAVDDPAVLFETLQTALTLNSLHPTARRTVSPVIAREMLSRFAGEERLYLDYGLPYALCQVGDWDEARLVTERAGLGHLEGWNLTCHLVTLATVRWMYGRLDDAGSALAELERAGVHPRWYHDYYPLLAEISADEGRTEDARAVADLYLALDVHPTEEANKLGVVSAWVRAEIDAALSGGEERDEHLERAREAVTAARELLEHYPPPTSGSLQMETPTTYLAFAVAELSRATGPDPEPWRDVVDRADHVYYRLYALYRLAEALLDAGHGEEAAETLRRAHADASALGAEGLKGRLERLAQDAGLDGPARQAPAGAGRRWPNTPSGS